VVLPALRPSGAASRRRAATRWAGGPAVQVAGFELGFILAAALAGTAALALVLAARPAGPARRLRPGVQRP